SDHVPGAINVTMIRAAVGTRAAWVVDPESDVVVAAATADEARRLARLLEAVGFRSIRGLLAGGTQAWLDAGLPPRTLAALDIPGLAAPVRAGDVRLLDVRDDDEWREGHVEGSTHVPYYELRNGIPDGLARNGADLAIACSVGNRSSIAASLLARAGVENIVHVTDGGVAHRRDREVRPARARGHPPPRPGRRGRRPRGRGDRARPGLSETRC